MSLDPNLEVLRLWSNYLSGNIPDCISNASKLKILELSQNSFTGIIPNTLGNLSFLEALRLWSNHLTTETPNHEWSFLSSLANCKNLRVLEIASNPLNGTLPTSILNLFASLQRFIAYDCKIKGVIPMEIGSLSNIIVLSLRQNELSGSIPATIGKLKQIQGLYLNDNTLQGLIPNNICHLEKLSDLSLSANMLQGPIPPCLGDLTSLRNLYLDSNKLHSTIPFTFWRLKDMLKVDLSSNYLNGSLPLDIGNLKVLIYLNLSRNLFSSDIPITIGGLNSLQNLSLSSNRLQGPIPLSLGDMISLETLDLSNNNLSGIIPKSLERLSYLRYFNVAFNKLEGEIPTEGCFRNFTAKSFMNNSALCGSPQLQVPHCKNNTHQPMKTISMHVLRYALPMIASIMVVLTFIIVLKKFQNQSTNLSMNEGLTLDIHSTNLYNRLLEATDRFNEGNLLGSGSFGSVYKGTISNGRNVAIKVFNLQLEGGFRSFDVESEVMQNILHRNLVKVISFCSCINFKALVLEFMPNGSLEKWLYSNHYFLDILQRINIMIDVASALEYLHLGHPNPIIHCDLKPSNVLLDGDMVAHVGDFGIAKLLGETESMKQTMTLGTIGYMAPEYGSKGIVSVKSDVYSYGILLMETFTRRKPTDEIFVGVMSMKHWVKESLSNETIGVADSSLLRREERHFMAKANCISSIMELALDCSVELPKERKDMKDVVFILQKIKIKYLNNIRQIQGNNCWNAYFGSIFKKQKINTTTI
ncbi:Serine-threonine/tyrosine-protein kinase [Theobroma cacao]|nr:Serine-threonine/tyrosine-protein kinase [Theobroma cacao]